MASPCSAAVASVCARFSASVSSQEELLGVALEAAIDEGDEDVVQQLMLVALREHRASLVAHGELIFTCVEKGFASAVTIMLAAGVPGMQRLSCGVHDVLMLGETPLHVACRHGHPKIVHLLLAGQAQIDARARDGASPLHVAAAHGQFTISRMLLASRAPVDRIDQLLPPALQARRRVRCFSIRPSRVGGHISACRG